MVQALIESGRLTDVDSEDRHKIAKAIDQILEELLADFQNHTGFRYR